MKEQLLLLCKENEHEKKGEKERGGKNQFHSGLSTSSYHFTSQLGGIEFKLTGTHPNKSLLFCASPGHAT